MTIWVNTIVNNEENFIWFAVMSVVDFVDKVLIYDTGSTDKTTNIIKEIQRLKGDKVNFKEIGTVNKFQFPKMRQAMLDQSKCDWILILDGDEIWWTKSIKQLIDKINKEGDRLDGIVVPMVVPVGDIYHRQEEVAGKYEILGRKGHYNLRAINKKIPGLHVDWPYGRESYLNESNVPIQEGKRVIFSDTPYFHVTHLKRTSSKNRTNKFKYELGKRFSEEFKLPEVFYKSYPKIVAPPWTKIKRDELIISYLLTPLRRIKRRILA
jgi:glycosyltransferase involved in cell wall biosynthesis